MVKGGTNFFAAKSENKRLLSFTLHQGTKTPGFDPVNVTTSWSGQIDLPAALLLRPGRST